MSNIHQRDCKCKLCYYVYLFFCKDKQNSTLSPMRDISVPCIMCIKIVGVILEGNLGEKVSPKLADFYLS